MKVYIPFHNKSYKVTKDYVYNIYDGYYGEGMIKSILGFPKRHIFNWNEVNHKIDQKSGRKYYELTIPAGSILEFHCINNIFFKMYKKHNLENSLCAAITFDSRLNGIELEEV